jgi:hypothetical protein
MDYIIARGLVVAFEIILMDFDSFEPILTFRDSAVVLLVILIDKNAPQKFPTGFQNVKNELCRLSKIVYYTSRPSRLASISSNVCRFGATILLRPELA